MIADSPPLRDAMCAMLRAAGVDPNGVASVSLDYKAPHQAPGVPEVMVRVELFMTSAMVAALTDAGVAELAEGSWP